MSAVLDAPAVSWWFLAATSSGSPISARSPGTFADIRVRATGATALAVTPYFARPTAAERTSETTPPLAAE